MAVQLSLSSTVSGRGGRRVGSGARPRSRSILAAADPLVAVRLASPWRWSPQTLSLAGFHLSSVGAGGSSGGGGGDQQQLWRRVGHSQSLSCPAGGQRATALRLAEVSGRQGESVGKICDKQIWAYYNCCIMLDCYLFSLLGFSQSFI